MATTSFISWLADMKSAGLARSDAARIKAAYLDDKSKNNRITHLR